MKQHDSAVDFATAHRIHLAFGCADLEASTTFYRDLFGAEPAKIRSDYVKFEVAEPPLNLSLHPVPDPVVPPVPEHLGIQVKTSAEVQTRSEHLKAKGHALRHEDETTCCYAVMDKVWAQDPDGRAWEIFVVTDADAPVHSLKTGTEDGACCRPHENGDEKAEAECCTA